MLLYRLDKMPVLDFQPDCLFPVCHLIRSLLLELRLAIPIRLTTMCLFVSLLLWLPLLNSLSDSHQYYPSRYITGLQNTTELLFYFNWYSQSANMKTMIVIEESKRDRGISKSSVPGMFLSFSFESDLSHTSILYYHSK
jgi:hypothetical protein